VRLAESKIREAILHPEEEVRLKAVGYFSYSQDETLMPLVIQAVEKYGKGFTILRRAGQLRQTGATVQWLMEELSKDWDLDDVVNDNYCSAVALLLFQTQPELLKPEVTELRCFPQELRGQFRERLVMANWDFDTGWRAFQQFGREVRQRGHFRLWDVRRGKQLVEALARHRDTASVVLHLLHRQYRGMDGNLMRWLESLTIELAGKMQLEEAIPVLAERLREGDLDLGNSSVFALAHIGGDKVVQAIAKHWPDTGSTFHNYGADVLEHIHTDLSVATCLAFLGEEEDPATKIFLANALLGSFADEAIEPVRQMVQGGANDLNPDEKDLRYRLVATCAVMGVSFSEYDEWYQDAVKNAWGKTVVPTFPIRRNFREGQEDVVFDRDDWTKQDRQPSHPAVVSHLATMLKNELRMPQRIEEGRKAVGRNEPCPCGSGKKFKKCCLKKQGDSPLD
jgi:hypothetical protein